MSSSLGGASDAAGGTSSSSIFGGGGLSIGGGGTSGNGAGSTGAGTSIAGSTVHGFGGSSDAGNRSTAGSTWNQAATGGVSTGGVETKIASTGGISAGGTSTDGISLGGTSTSGISAGGTSNGGISTHFVSTGGISTGGASGSTISAGGVSTGGVATGGIATSGGVATGGIATGGDTTALISTGGVAAGGASSVIRGLPNGSDCQNDAQCESTHCVDAVCCNTPCDDQCETCNDGTTPGICASTRAAQPVNGRTPCTNAGSICGGSCTGAKGCTYPGSSTQCDSTTRCINPTTSQIGLVCNAAGSCAQPLTTTCTTPTVCNVNIDGKCGFPAYTQVETGHAHTCAVVSDGTLRCWGSAAYGRLGVGVTEDKFRPMVIPEQTNVAAVATGWGHTCVLARDGKVTCWGANFNGNLGCHNLKLTMTPTQCTPFDSDSGVLQLGAGGEHTCAVLTSGRVKCWGRDDWGQAGSDSFDSQYDPIYVAGITNAVAVAGGTWQTCALLADGSVLGWGNNERGVLGAGPFDSAKIASPVPMLGIDGKNAKAIGIDVSETASCVLLDDFSMRCSGDDSYGQLGDGRTARSNVPVLAQPSLKAQAIAVGDSVTCALVNSRSVRCWGRGDTYGGLGNGSYGNSSEPVDVRLPPDIDFTSVQAKANHLCVLSTTGRIWCWGDNTYGQLGSDSPLFDSSVPVEVLAPGY